MNDRSKIYIKCFLLTILLSGIWLCQIFANISLVDWALFVCTFDRFDDIGYHIFIYFFRNTFIASSLQYFSFYRFLPFWQRNIFFTKFIKQILFYRLFVSYHFQTQIWLMGSRTAKGLFIIPTKTIWNPSLNSIHTFPKYIFNTFRIDLTWN